MSGTSFDVIIVGAGISGLTSTYELKRICPTLKVLVVEANDRLGGRLCKVTLRGPNGTAGDFDIGGHWVSRTQPHVSKLAKDLELEVAWQDFQGAKILMLGDSERRLYQNSPTGGLPLTTALDWHLVFRQIQKLQDELVLGPFHTCANARELDGLTLETFKQHSLKTRAGKAVFDLVTRSFLGADPAEMSLLFFLHYCRLGGGLKQITDSAQEGNAQEQFLKVGAHGLIQELANRIGQSNIRTNAVVTSISQTDDHITVQLSNDVEITSKFVIVSSPVHLKARINYWPPLPRNQASLLERLPIGNLIKFIATYEKKFWKDQGLSGEAAYCPLQTKERYLVDFTMDSSIDGTPALVGFICGTKSHSLSQLTDKEQKDCIIKSLVHFFGEAAAEVIDIVIKDWSKEPFTGGCPVGISPPGTYTLYDEENLRRPFGRIHWAGTETATLWKGYIDGAIQSGWRSAYEVLAHLKDNFTAPMPFEEQDIFLKEEPGKQSLFSFRLGKRQAPEKEQ